MYCGSNKTALASQRQVAQAMMQLIQEKPYSRITISELCKTAGISRQTFYSLFTSRENVMIFTIQAQYCCDLDEIPIHQARRQSEKHLSAQRSDMVLLQGGFLSDPVCFLRACRHSAVLVVVFTPQSSSRILPLPADPIHPVSLCEYL